MSENAFYPIPSTPRCETSWWCDAPRDGFTENGRRHTEGFSGRVLVGEGFDPTIGATISLMDRKREWKIERGEAA